MTLCQIPILKFNNISLKRKVEEMIEKGKIMKEIEGCAHLYMKNGEPVRLITHLSELPKDGVVHLKGSKMYSNKEFKNSHPQDVSEFGVTEEGIILSDF